MRSHVVVVAMLASCSHSSSNLRTEAPASPPSEPAATVAASASAAPPSVGPPRARTVNVTETRFGLTVSDRRTAGLPGRVAERADPREQRLAAREPSEVAAGPLALRDEPRVQLGIVVALHPAIRILDDADRFCDEPGSVLSTFDLESDGSSDLVCRRSNGWTWPSLRSRSDGSPDVDANLFGWNMVGGARPRSIAPASQPWQRRQVF